MVGMPKHDNLTYIKLKNKVYIHYNYKMYVDKCEREVMMPIIWAGTYKPRIKRYRDLGKLAVSSIWD